MKDEDYERIISDVLVTSLTPEDKVFVVELVVDQWRANRNEG